MHGSIFLQLQHYVTAHHGAPAWAELMWMAGVPERTYQHSETYPDAEAAALLRCAATLRHKPYPELLEDFGEFITPWLMELYAPLIPETWGTLELLLNTEQTIHTIVRSTTPGAEPPRLAFTQTGPCRLRFVYDSPRRLGGLAKGIIQGVANHYGDKVEVRETHGAGGAVEMDIQILPREGPASS
jgi:hypothetical protein